MDKYIVGKDGYKKMIDKLENLKKNERPETVEELEKAREKGDLKENAEYHAAKEKLGFIDDNIADLEQKIANARIVEKTQDKDKVGFGSKVKVYNNKLDEEQEFTIVSTEESDISQLKISLESPIGNALMGAKKGEEVVAKVPSGEMKLEILEIE